jgi:hypothetical protein
VVEEDDWYVVVEERVEDENCTCTNEAESESVPVP